MKLRVRPTKITPLPWELEDNFIQKGKTVIGEIYDKGLYLPSEDYEIAAEGEANSAFIVKACNTWETLVNALRYVVDSGESYERVQEVAERALAQALGEK